MILWILLDMLTHYHIHLHHTSSKTKMTKDVSLILRSLHYLDLFDMDYPTYIGQKQKQK